MKIFQLVNIISFLKTTLIYTSQMEKYFSKHDL